MLRLLLVILCALIGAHSLLSGVALTLKDISLMLRSGYSSKAILEDLASRQFTETLVSSFRLRYLAVISN